MADFGYDVADYCGVDPVFGTLEDFDRLIAAAHGRGLKVLVDFVPNHTSEQHPWFVESRSSPDSPKRDWYVWRDPKPDGVAAQQLAVDLRRAGLVAGRRADGQYYLHSFLASQPDLNWRNPEVEAAMLDGLRFWLERGVDGFRIDALWAVDEGRGAAATTRPTRTSSRATSLGYLRVKPEFSGGPARADGRDPPDAAPCRRLRGRPAADRRDVPADRAARRLLRRGQRRGAPAVQLQAPAGRRGRPSAIDRTDRRYEAALPQGAWPNWVLGNHDQPRIASRLGPRGAGRGRSCC